MDFLWQNHSFVVDINRLVSNFNDVTGNADDTLDEITAFIKRQVRVHRKLENDDITALWITQHQGIDHRTTADANRK